MKQPTEMISSNDKRGLSTRGARVELLKSKPLALICFVLLAANLPRLTSATHPNYTPSSQLARRFSAATAPLPAAQRPSTSFLSQGDQRTHYELLEAAGANQPALDLLDPSEAALLSYIDLFQEKQPERPKLARVAAAEGEAQPKTPQGYYEFEVAPKMEPPSAPKPPFKQASYACPGSDPFGGFSPRHTLCGDLYQGKVPLNPMGQFVNDQAYPFELIKNKTLQFLARSLPILKEEYETIPKVARYLPANQLLNPTSHQSPLGHEHFHTLNQFEHQSASELMAAMAQPMAPPFLRRKRSPVAGGSTSRQQQQASITVAELMPNASLVVSSAHSSAGRIGGNNHGARSVDALPSQQFTMITKDGHRSIGTGNVGGGQAGAAGSASSSPNRARGQPHDAEHRPLVVVAQTQQVAGSKPLSSPTSSSGHQQQGQMNGGSQQQPAPKSHAANQIGSSGQSQQQQPTDTISGREHHHAMSPQAIESKATNSDAAPHTNNNNQRQQQQQQHLLARSAPQTLASDATGHQQGRQQESAPAASTAGSQGQPGQNPHRGGPAAGFSSGLPRAAGKQSAGSNGSPLKCSNVNGLLMYTVCQAASALIEPADATPTWLQAAKQIGTLYAAASNTDSYSAGPTASPLWALWSAFSPSAADKSSSSSPSESTDQSGQDLSYKSSNGNHQSKAGNQTPISSVTSVISLLNPLMSFFGPSLQRAGDAGSSQGISKPGNKSSSTHHSGLTNNLKTMSNLLLTGLSIAGLYDWLGTSGLFTPTATTFARRKKPYDPSETFVDTPVSLAAMASARQLSPGATVGGAGAGNPIKQPPTPCPSVEEYISPTFARNYQGAWKYVVQIPHEGYFTQTIQRSSCTRQKCEFTEGVCHEAPRWVSLLVAEIYYPNTVLGTPPPSQSQQHPASSQIANDRLALDAGGQPNAAMLHQLMATAPSTNQLQQVALGSAMMSPNNPQQLLHQAKSIGGAPHHQDPLQMTDSLNNYNHKLHSAFMNAATELGLDPTNMAQMQQLANAHNYQFLQRNGLMPMASQSQQQQQQPQVVATNQAPAEPRSYSPSTNQITRREQQQQPQYGPAMRVASSQQQFVEQPQQQQVFSNDYIKALALETIRRHPHLSIDDLIKSLQMQPQARKKRDLSPSGGSQQLNSGQTMSSMAPSQQSQQYNQNNHNQQARSSAIPPPAPQQNPSAEGSPSVNELGMETHLPQRQHQQHQFDMASMSAPTQTSSSHPQYQVMGSHSQMDGNQQANMLRSNQLDQQQQQPQQTNQILASQSSLTHDIAAANQQSQQQPHHHHHHTFQSDQQQAHAGSDQSPAGNQVNTPASSQTESQTECDGHDKIGCYVVRVYYDWFLVNGSCKCWKTNGQQQNSGHSLSSSGGSSSSSGSAGFIRRIFTG